MTNEGCCKPEKKLAKETKDMHRAIASLIEELEAVDYYNQRINACVDPNLRTILKHNRDEEKEHAAMLLKWISHHDPSFVLPQSRVPRRISSSGDLRCAIRHASDNSEH